MFIRRTQTRRTADGKPYFSHRLVHTERLGHTVRQRTLLNLGRHFDIAQADWPLLCTRITDVLSGQAPLMADCPPAVEEEAQRIAAQLLARGAQASTPTGAAADIQRVDVDSLRLVRPRSIGVEQLGLWALEQVGLPDLLARLGVNGALRTAAAGLIVGRLAHPASERETHRWLQHHSGLGELLGVDFETVGAMQLYRASDQLVKHREAIETHLFDRALGLLDLQPTVTLYDLTNTYFEGEASEQPQAKRGHSKERRSDCPLLTLGLMLDASGFVRRSKVFAGNVREHRTLAGMLEALDAPAGALVVVDRGIATEAAITWLRENHYRYLVVSRERHRQFDADAAVCVRTQSNQTVHLHKGRRHRPRRSPPLLLLGGAGREGTRYRRAFRHPLRGRPDQTQQRALTPPRPQARRPGLAAHRAPQGPAYPRRRPLPDQRHRRRDRQPGRRRHLDPTPPGRLDAHPSRRLLLAQQRDRLG